MLVRVVVAGLGLAVFAQSTDAALLNRVVGRAGVSGFGSGHSGGAGANYPLAPGTVSENNGNFSYTLTSTTTPVDLSYSIRQSGGTAQYLWSTNFQNATNTPLTSLSVQLGTGVGADFRPLPVGSGIFLTEVGPEAVSTHFHTHHADGQRIDYTDGVIDGVATTLFAFNLVLSDQALASTNAVTFRYTVVPEPSVLALAAPLVLARRRRGR